MSTNENDVPVVDEDEPEVIASRGDVDEEVETRPAGYEKFNGDGLDFTIRNGVVVRPGAQRAASKEEIALWEALYGDPDAEDEPTTKVVPAEFDTRGKLLDEDEDEEPRDLVEAQPAPEDEPEEHSDSVHPLVDVDFASDVAVELAIDEGVTADELADYEQPVGVDDVRDAINRRES